MPNLAGSADGRRGTIDRHLALEGRVVELAVAAGDRVGAGSMLAIIESMKMHHDVVAPAAGVIVEVATAANLQIGRGAVIATLRGRR